VVKEWRRLASHNLRKEEQMEIIENNHYFYLCRRILDGWKTCENIKIRAFTIKMKRVL
jgi:hypothetical protein